MNQWSGSLANQYFVRMLVLLPGRKNDRIVFFNHVDPLHCQRPEELACSAPTS